MVDQDLDELRRLLRHAFEGSRMYARDVEKALGIGHGNLERLLNGTLELRVRHLLAFARLLKIPPADFFELGCPHAAGAAQNRLADWLGPERSRELGVSRPSANPGDLAEIVRAAVREELAAREGSSVGAKPPRR